MEQQWKTFPFAIVCTENLFSCLVVYMYIYCGRYRLFSGMILNICLMKMT